MGYIFYPSGGKFHVSLALPGQDSVILKGIGKEGKANFLIPNIDYLIQCAVQGELGIADSIKKAKAVQNLNKCKSAETLKFLAKSLGVTIDGDPEKWRKTTGYAIPSSAVFLNNSMSPVAKADLGSVASSFENQGGDTPHAEIPKSMEDVGLKALEKAVIKASLEQYKPWIEIAKLLIQHLAQIEDVAARVMAVAQPSKIPKGNAGTTSRPKAIGYGNGADIKSGIGKVDSLNRKMAAKRAKRYGGTQSGLTASISPTASNSNGYGTDNSVLPNGFEYQILSTLYSTGKFDPYVNYKFIYIDIDDDELGQLDDDFSGLDFEDNDPYKDKRPQSIIFGFYDSKGNQIDPSSNIKSYIKQPNGNLDYQGDIDVDAAAGTQGVQKADWIERQRNIRWFGNFGTRGPVYKWEGFGDSPTNPSGGDPYREYKQLFYDGTNRDAQTNNPTTDGEPNSPVLSFSNEERSEYVELLMTTVDYKFNKLEPGELTPEEKSSYRQKINTEATQNVQAILEGMTLYGFNRSMRTYGAKNPDGTPASLPTNLINSYRPRKITIANGEEIWIDPETDYDMKLIRVDPITKIKYQLPGSATEREAEILRFVKNTVEISTNNSSNFNIDIIRYMPDSVNSSILRWEPFLAFTTPIAGRYENLNKFTFDNWNYRTGTVGLYSVTPDVKLNTPPSVLIRIWSQTAPQYWSDKYLLTWKSGSNNYIFKKITGGNWKIGKYEEVLNNNNESKNNWGTTLTTIDINDNIIKKIKVKDSYSSNEYARYYYDNILEWYYQQPNGFLGWTASAPSSFKNSTNNSLEIVDIKKSGTIKEVNDPNDVLVTETNKYKITTEYNSNDGDSNPSKQYKFSVRYTKTTQTYKSLSDNYIEKTDKAGVFSEVNANLKLGNKIEIPLDNGKSSFIYINQDNILTAWEYLFFDTTSATTLDNYLPTDIGKKITWNLNASQLGTPTFGYLPDMNSGSPQDNNTTSKLFTKETTTIPPNQIRLKEPNNPFGALLDPRRVVNRQLYEENPLINKYSNDIYGQSSEGDPTKIGIVYRYMKSEYDTETYYVVEGLIPSINTGGDGGSNQSGGNNSGGDSSGGYYKKKDFLGAIKVFISVLSDIFSKLIPAIKKLISLFKNPANFIVEIIKEKLGESMKVFSPEFLNDYQQMIALPKLDPNTGENLRKDFVKNSSLNEYVFVSPTGDYKVLFDGAALKKLEILGLTIIFGIEVNHKKPVPVKLIFKIDLKSATENSLQSILDGSAKDQNLGGLGNTQQGTGTPNSNGNNPASGSVDQMLNGESVSIVYSTGKYIEGINYKYIYVTEYVSNLVNEANQLAQSDDVDQLNEAMRKYDEALQADPTNPFILDKLKELMKKIPNYMSSLLELLLALITAPLKLITQVVEYIIGVFTNLSFGSFIPKIIEFLSFTWLITSGPKIFGPANLFKAFGLETLPLVLPPPFTDAGWSQGAALMALYKAGIVPPTSDIKPQYSPYPTDRTTSGIDFNKVLSFTFGPFTKKPSIEKSISPVGMASMSKEHILTIFKKSPNIEYDKFNLSVGIPPIMELMSQFICLIEAFINAIIDLFWAILGLELVIPPEKVHLKLCKKFSEPGLTPEEANSILNPPVGGNTSAIPSANLDDYSFIYTVTTKDGEVVSELNDQQLQEWVSEHSSFQYEYLYNNNVDVKNITTEPINNDSGDLYKRLGGIGLNTNPDSIPQNSEWDINKI